MRSVQSQQPREMRINTEPLRRQDTKNVRMRHQQHIVSSVEQRFDRGDRLTCARRSFLHRLTRTVVHGHLLAVRQSFNPIAFQRFGKCLRTVAPHIPSETARRALARGDMATILLMTPSLQPHRMVIADGGWWEQRGGLWGPSRPGDPPVLLAGWDARCTRERGNLLDLASE